jgi:integrase/recombinase XerD
MMQKARQYRKSGRHKLRISWLKVLRIAEQEQIQKYLDSLDLSNVKNRQVKFIYELLLNTGLRVSELAMLRMCDLPAYHGANEINVFQGKGNKDRPVPISIQLKQQINDYIKDIRPRTLSRWIKKNPDSKQLLLYTLNKTEFVYEGTIKRIVKNKQTGHKEEVIKKIIRASTTLNRMISDIAIRAGLVKRLTPHMLRHTYIVNALLNHVDIHSLMIVVGHSSIEQTDAYTPLTVMENPHLGEMLCGGKHKDLEWVNCA